MRILLETSIDQLFSAVSFTYMGLNSVIISVAQLLRDQILLNASCRLSPLLIPLNDRLFASILTAHPDHPVLLLTFHVIDSLQRIEMSDLSY